MIDKGTGDPLVLFHGVTCSERVWNRTESLLSPHCRVIVLTAQGHRGGNAATSITTVSNVVDDAERALDELGIETAHIAGNSMGGWIAIELARRGRARSVCALSPAGCWTASAANQSHATESLKNLVKLVQRTRWALPVLAHLGVVRRIAMRDNAVRGDRLTPVELIDMADDLLGCTARYDLLSTEEELKPLDPLPCPIMLAWSGCDRIFPPQVNGPVARALMPAATWRELPGVGHLPMLDSPALVATTILDSMMAAGWQK